MDERIGIRPLRETDAEAVVELYARAATVEPRLGPITLAQWQRFTKFPQNHAGRDFRIAEQDGHPMLGGVQPLLLGRDGRTVLGQLALDLGDLHCLGKKAALITARHTRNFGRNK